MARKINGVWTGLRSSQVFILLALIVGGGFFVLAVTTTYSPLQLFRSRFDPLLMIFVNLLAGLVEVVVGYESMTFFGGRHSLDVAALSSRLMGSKQIIEIREGDPPRVGQRLAREAYLLYVPFIVFIITTAIAWDIYNADSVHSGIFRPFFHLLDIFSRTTGANIILYSLELTPLILLLTFMAGIVPSVALPYFRGFKVTGINSSPFHTSLLVTVVGLVAGVSVLFTLFGLYYEILLLQNTPLYYHYVLLVTAGFSLYYSVGSRLGLERAEVLIKESLSKSKEKDRVFEGSVSFAHKV